MALQRHWVSRANVSASGCYKQLAKIHKLRRSVTCPAPNLVRKGWGLRCLHWLWTTETPGADFFWRALWNGTALDDIYFTACFENERPPAELQIMSLAAILSHNTWIVSVPLLVGEGQQGATSCCVATHHQFPTKPPAITHSSQKDIFLKN